MSQDPSKTQSLILAEHVRELRESKVRMEERLRIVENSAAETKIYFQNMMDSMEEVKDSVDDLKEKSSEAKGTLRGLTIAASMGGGVGALLTKFFGGGH
jgi:hypothetical protein